MQIQIHSIHFDADQRFWILSMPNSRSSSPSMVTSKVVKSFLRVEKSETRDNKVVEVKAHVPGKDLFAKRRAVSFEAAMDEVHEALRRQVMKAHA